VLGKHPGLRNYRNRRSRPTVKAAASSRGPRAPRASWGQDRLGFEKVEDGGARAGARPPFTSRTETRPCSCRGLVEESPRPCVEPLHGSGCIEGSPSCQGRLDEGGNQVLLEHTGPTDASRRARRAAFLGPAPRKPILSGDSLVRERPGGWRLGYPILGTIVCAAEPEDLLDCVAQLGREETGPAVIASRPERTERVRSGLHHAK